MPERREGRQLRMDSPLGLLRAGEREGAVTALVFAGQKYERRHLPPEVPEEETPLLRELRSWLEAYFDGERPDPRAIPVHPEGTAFQRRVWQALSEIPYGQIVTYGQLADRLNSSPRAVGAAVGRNPVSVLIPCHRVLGADGSLTGYAGGLERKRRLLLLEGIRGI